MAQQLPPQPPNENSRLAALAAHQVLDTGNEEAFDELTRLAARICDAPISLLTLVDGNRQWFKSTVGLAARETPRDQSFCAHAILGRDVLLVPDALADARFARNPLVTGDPKIRFYAGSPLVTPEGHALGTLCVIDRRPRQLLEEQVAALRTLSHAAMALFALKDRERRLADIQRIARVGMWTMEPATDREWWSDEAYRLLGYAPGEVPASFEFFLTHVHRADRDRLQENLRQALAARQDIHFEFRVLRRDGSLRTFLTKARLALDDAGLPARAIGITQDITELRQAEERINEQAGLLDEASDAIVVRDLEQRIRYWYRGATKLYGWTREQVDGRKASSLLFKNPAQEQEVLKTVLEAGEWTGELKKVTKAGRDLTVWSRWTLIRDDVGKPKGVLSIDTDLTEQKLLEAQMLRAQRMESIGALAGGIAHDLNNALAPIVMALEMLKRDMTDGRSLRLISTAEASAQRGAEMVKQILGFARGMDAARAPLQPRHLMREIEKIARETFPKSIEVRGDFPADLWNVSGDATQLHQVLLNLCVNARDAMPGGGTLKLSAENVRLDDQYAAMNPGRRAGAYVALRVADAGTGISADIREKIFEPFFTTKEEGKGTGLGLSTTLAIVKRHGGFVDLDSEVGKGATFTAYLPASAAAAAEAAALRPAVPMGGGELILVADDEATIREIVKETLQSSGYRVLTAGDGAEAVVLYVENRANVAAVIVDMNMPIMDGVATVRALRKIDPSVKLIATSGRGETRPMLSEGSSVPEFLAKPYTADTLLLTLHRALRAV